MSGIWKYFKKFWMWFFRWPSWFEVGAAIILLLTVLYLTVDPLGNFGVFLLSILVFLILSGLWLIRLVYRLVLMLPFIVHRFGRPYAGTQPIKKMVFRWAFWPVIVGLIFLTIWQEHAVKCVGFRIWRPAFMAVVESKNLDQYSNCWIGWYQISNVTRDAKTPAVKFESRSSFFDCGGFIYSPNAKPEGPYGGDLDHPDFVCRPLGSGWYVWIQRF